MDDDFLYVNVSAGGGYGGDHTCAITTTNDILCDGLRHVGPVLAAGRSGRRHRHRDEEEVAEGSLPTVTVAEAAALLARGEPVAFPTETVYGSEPTRDRRSRFARCSRSRAVPPTTR
jgi:hypothetical protein